MTKKPHAPQADQSDRGSNAKERDVIGLEEAGENFGVEDTPSNAPEEIEAKERLQSNRTDERTRKGGVNDTHGAA